MKLIFLVLLCCASIVGYAQKITWLNQSYNSSIRGLSVVNDQVIWASGSNGSVALSTDGGSTFRWMTVPGMDKRDFRDIHAFDDRTAVIMAVAEPAVILKTTDAGKSWNTVYMNATSGMFLDAMDFVDNTHGLVIGDPITGKMFLAETTDGGNSWMEKSFASLSVQQGEACFASSGTNIIAQPSGFFLLTGGTASRLITEQLALPVGLIQGKETTGGNSIAYFKNVVGNKDLLVAVGGDFTEDSSSEKNMFLSPDHGQSWTAPIVSPKGYKSCITFVTANKLVTCGTSGIDVSQDGGLHWKHVSDESFHVVQRALKGKSIILAGGKGRIAKLEF